MSIYITFCGCYTTNVLRLFFGIQFLLASVGDFRGGSRDSVDGGLSYGAIFSIDGTNCSPKAVLACRSVNLVFISFSVQ